MQIKAISLALVLSVGAAPCAQAGSDRYAPARAFIEQALAKSGTPSISVAVFRDGHIDWEEGFGWADRENKIKAAPETIYSIASISKTFTATGVMMLAKKGVIDLDRPINTYLGGATLTVRVGNESDVTVRRVASHTAGLPFHFHFFYSGGPDAPPPADVTIARYGNIVSPPGDHFFYSNLGFGILSDLIAVQTHQSYADFMRQSVFAPLGLTRTSVDLIGAPDTNAAARYNLDGTRLPFYVTDHPGASEIYTSANDLIRFAAFQLKARLPGQHAILDDEALDVLHTTQAREDDTHGYGLGFETSTRSGYQVVSHSGSMPGVATEMLMVPSKGIAIVVLSNSSRGELVDEVTDNIASLLLPGWKPDSGGLGFPQADKPFVPSRDMVGKWAGHIARPEGDMPLEIDMAADGTVTALVGDQPATPIGGALMQDDDFIGQMAASVHSQDAERYKYILYVKLHHAGRRLFGTVTALDDIRPTNDHLIGGLSFWTDLNLVQQ